MLLIDREIVSRFVTVWDLLETNVLCVVLFKNFANCKLLVDSHLMHVRLLFFIVMRLVLVFGESMQLEIKGCLFESQNLHEKVRVITVELPVV